VYIAALDFTFDKVIWPSVQDTMPYCAYEKSCAVCRICQHKATLTLRLTESTEQVVVGGAEAYAPVCMQCYSNHELIVSDAGGVRTMSPLSDVQ
jgi:thymidine kinase